jgi:hypothetical protein
MGDEEPLARCLHDKRQEFPMYDHDLLRLNLNGVHLSILDDDDPEATAHWIPLDQRTDRVLHED